MPAVAKKDGVSQISATDGAKGTPCASGRFNWNSATTQSSDQGSSDVFAENIGVVRKDDAMISHPDGDPCVSSPVNHAPTLSTYSTNVFANFKEIGRVGDNYKNSTSFDHIISTGASTVFAN